MNKKYGWEYLGAASLCCSFLVSYCAGPVPVEFTQKTVEFKNTTDKEIVLRVPDRYPPAPRYQGYKLMPGETKSFTVGPKLSFVGIKMTEQESCLKPCNDHTRAYGPGVRERCQKDCNTKYPNFLDSEALKLQIKEAPEKSLFEITIQGNVFKVVKIR